MYQLRRPPAPPNAVRRGERRGRRRPRRAAGSGKGLSRRRRRRRRRRLRCSLRRSLRSFIRRGERGRAVSQLPRVVVCMCVEWSGVTCVWYAVVLTVRDPRRRATKRPKEGIGTTWDCYRVLGFGKKCKTTMLGEVTRNC